MCIYEGSSPCDSACGHLQAGPSFEQLQALFLPLPPLPSSTESDPAFLTEINALAGDNEQWLQTVATQAKQLQELYTGLQGSLQGLKADLSRTNKYNSCRLKEEVKELAGAADLTRLLVPCDHFLHSLRLCSRISPLLYRGKVFRCSIFSLSLKVQSSAPLLPPFSLQIEVFSVIKPLVRVLSKRSAPILEGTCSIQVNSLQTICFPALRFTDVTKHCAYGRVHLVILAPERPDVRPLVLEGLRVKARNRSKLD